jgi:hypothetical protein
MAEIIVSRAHFDALAPRGVGFRAFPQLSSPFLASVQDGFFLRKNPLGSHGFGTQ